MLYIRYIITMIAASFELTSLQLSLTKRYL